FRAFLDVRVACIGELTVKFGSSLNVCSVRRLWRIEVPEMMALAAFVDVSHKLAVLVHGYALITSTVVASATCVPRILSVCRQSKVSYPIVGTVTVYVINLLRRPLPMDIKPCKPMSAVALTAYADENISLRLV